MAMPEHVLKDVASRVEVRDGVTYWTAGPRAGKVAGYLRRDGYRYIGTKVDGKRYKEMAHRVVWYKHHGRIPEIVDHIDRDRDNNDIANLREVSLSANARNAPSYGESRFKGVFKGKPREGYTRWRAAIYVDNTRYGLGTFTCQSDAAIAYDLACYVHDVDEFANPNFPGATYAFIL